MKHTRIAVVCALALALATPVAMSKTLDLIAVDFPERKTVDLNFSAQTGAPLAKMTAKVTYRDGQARIEVSYQDMKPAILFGGDVTCYVVWAVSRDGDAVNLGELLAASPKGKIEFSTSKKAFAMLVTTEPYYLVKLPSALPAFVNDAPKGSDGSGGFNFSSFREKTPRRAMESITEIAWDSRTPLELLQARKAFELAGELKAQQYADDFYSEAFDSLSMANEQFDKSPGGKKLIDYARRSVALSNEAINISVHRIEGIQLEEEIARRRAEMGRLEEQAVLAKEQAEKAKEMAAAMAAETAELGEQKARMEREMSGLREETAELTELLEGALGHVAETRNTARGYVVNLPDILFDLNKATLKPQAEKVIAKLTGILLVMQDFDVRVEGFTDSTGTEDYNLKLSRERAESVMAFMAGEGIEQQRIEAVGFGMANPVADNTSEEGRRKNRRVEIVLTER